MTAEIHRPAPATPAPAAPAFRGHRTDAPPTQRSTSSGGLFDQLIDEWPRLCAMPSTTSTLRRWAATEPALTGHTNLGGILDHLDAGTPADDDRILLALIRLAQTGEQLAGRTLVQAMLPKISRLAARTRPSSDDQTVDDHRQTAVATFWEALHRYPAERRHTRVAANLALDTLHQLTDHQRQPLTTTPVSPDAITWLLLTTADTTADVDDLRHRAELAATINWALTNGAITEEEAHTLRLVYLSRARTEQRRLEADAAHTLGLSHAAVRQRCSRARRRITAAVHARNDRPASHRYAA